MATHPARSTAPVHPTIRGRKPGRITVSREAMGVGSEVVSPGEQGGYHRSGIGPSGYFDFHGLVSPACGSPKKTFCMIGLITQSKVSSA